MMVARTILGLGTVAITIAVASVALWATATATIILFIGDQVSPAAEVEGPSVHEQINYNLSSAPNSTSMATTRLRPATSKSLRTKLKYTPITGSIHIESNTNIHTTSTSKKNRRLIIGGEAATKEHNYDFFVHFEGDRMCGGSLIAPMVVLTAGHCWSGTITPDGFSIGPVYETDTEDSNHIITKRRIGRAAEYRIHPDYNAAKDIANDFLLLRLSSIETVEQTNEPPATVDYDFDDNYSPWRDDRSAVVPEDLQDRTVTDENVNTQQQTVTPHESYRYEGEDRWGDWNRRHLRNNEEADESGVRDLGYIRLNPDPSIPADYSPLTVVGMGYDDDMKKAESLRHIRGGTFRKIPNSVCNAADSYAGAIDEEIMFCAGTMEGGLDACQGDSGSPLFYYDDEGRPVQVGLVSWGRGCGLPNLPSVYADVSSAYGWIRDVVCGDWKSAILNSADDRNDSDDDDWFLCHDYDDQQVRDQTGGIFSTGSNAGADTDANANANLGDLGCDMTTEASLEFQLTADAYGWETTWELLSGNDGSDGGIGSDTPNRVAGDQLFNDHETRFYRFCLPREGVQRDGGGEDYYGNNGIDHTHCYSLNVHDRMYDGMASKTKGSNNNDGTGGEGTNATIDAATSVDPAGFGIRFGNARAYEDFGFPDFDGKASFVLCPAAIEMDGNDGTANEESRQEDTIYVITKAPTLQPSNAPTDLPTAFPTATQQPTNIPSDLPTAFPTATKQPTEATTDLPTYQRISLRPR